SARQRLIHGDEILDAGHFAREHDGIARQSELFGAACALERGHHEGLAHDLCGVARIGAFRVWVHAPREELLVEAAPVDADAGRFPPFERLLDHDRELAVALRSLADVARIDTV